MAKGYTKPVTPGNTPFTIPNALIEAQENFRAKRKLNRILKSKNVKDMQGNIGQIVDVFVKANFKKRGEWILGKPVLSFDRKAEIVIVPDKQGHVLRCATEDCRHSPLGSFAAEAQKRIYELKAEQDFLDPNYGDENKIFRLNADSQSSNDSDAEFNDTNRTTHKENPPITTNYKSGNNESLTVPSYDETDSEDDEEGHIGDEDHIMAMLERNNINTDVDMLPDNFSSTTAMTQKLANARNYLEKIAT
eukprot:Plantae.Rhodophyta-Palmaria_palmata.ctg5732.p1 GENE.Plantae.Rhodophyta-Palmaria_palmata.ctg5732~~Plantae.Rhodophyta-Palmaria_palmata.ctg5732.p1  ORF type:complete len:248 (+),score=23.46 Plantae.Rhodophyta-Palmaria_palmata.ctg5732:32-775(+)